MKVARKTSSILRYTRAARRKGKPVVIKYVPKQTGKRKSISLDKKRKAAAPGKRRSRSGRIYYEYRRNRTDLRGKRI